MEMEILYEAPKLHELGSLVEGEVMVENNLLHPCTIMQGLHNLLIFPLRRGKDQWRNVDWSFPSSHGACQKGVFFPFPTVMQVAV
jgi:hypothetical protein